MDSIEAGNAAPAEPTPPGAAAAAAARRAFEAELAGKTKAQAQESLMLLRRKQTEREAILGNPVTLQSVANNSDWPVKSLQSSLEAEHAADMPRLAAYAAIVAGMSEVKAQVIEPTPLAQPNAARPSTQQTDPADVPHWMKQAAPPPPAPPKAPAAGAAKAAAVPKARKLKDPKAAANLAANAQAASSALAAEQGAAPALDPQERDEALMRQIGARYALVASGSAEGLTRNEVAKLAASDIGAIGSIQDQERRGRALVVVAESRRERVFYKEEFDRQAPQLGIEADAARARLLAPRSDEQERAHWLDVRRRDEAAQASVENTITLTPARAVLAGLAHDAGALAKEVVAGPLLPLRNAEEVAGVAPLNGGVTVKQAALGVDIGEQTRWFRGVAGDAEYAMTGPDGGVDAAMAKKMVAGHLATLGRIGDAHLRNLTTDAIWEAAHAQQHYRSELAAQSPTVFAGYAALVNKAQFLSSIDPAVAAETTRQTDDAWRLRAIVANARAMEAGTRGALPAADASEAVRADVAALRAIEDAEVRRLALLLMERSQVAQVQYRVALTRQAPDIGVEAHAAYLKHQPARQPLVPVQGTAALDAMARDLAAPHLLQDAAGKPVPIGELAKSTRAYEMQLRDNPASTDEQVSWAKEARKTAEMAADAAHTAAQSVMPEVDRSTIVPDAVAKRFTRVDNDYYLPSEKTPAFLDRGTRLSTRGEKPMVIASMVEIAKARGWEHATVGGTEPFRREAWLALSRVGVQVEGYQPNAQDLADLARQPAANSIAQAPERVQAAPAPALTLVKPAEPAPATPAKAALAAGQQAELRTKAQSFANDKPSFVIKKYPDLAPAYGTLNAAVLFAAEHLPGHEEQFAAIARAGLVEIIARGDKVPAPLLKQDMRKTPERGQGPAKGDELQRTR